MESPPAALDAAKLAEEYREFTYRVSHDLSAPVRGMVEFSKLLKSDHSASLDEEGLLFLSFIVDSGEKLQSMMAGLTAYSRLDTLTPQITTVDCAQLIEECRRKLEPLIEEKNASLRIEPLPAFESDSDLLREVFMILLENALLFQAPDRAPNIVVRAENVVGNIALAFDDNGIGIPEIMRPKLFKPFARLHGEEDYPGTGMGLALAAKIARRLGGGIAIADKAGPGVVMRLLLPRITT